MSEEPETRELKAKQLAQELEERKRAGSARDEEEEAKHARRAEKARYLRQKLEERAESEREAGQDQEG